MRKTWVKPSASGAQKELTAVFKHSVKITFLLAVVNLLAYARFVQVVCAPLYSASGSLINLVAGGLYTKSTGLVTKATKNIINTYYKAEAA